MPIHDQGYRRYGGMRAPHGHSWAVIAKAGVRTLLGKRAFIGLLLISWLPFFVRAVQIYAAANLPQAAFLAPDARMFRDFLHQQEAFLFFITVYAGAGLSTAAPPECVLLYEPLDFHDYKGVNVLFVDGRVQFIGEIEAGKAVPKLRKGKNPPWTGSEPYTPPPPPPASQPATQPDAPMEPSPPPAPNVNPD